MLFTIISNKEIKKNSKYIREMKAYIEEKGHLCETAKVLQDDFKNYIYDINNNTDIIISLGGDGTVLQAAQNGIELNIPVLSFNTGTLGFLAEYKIRDFKKIIDNIIEEEYEIEERFLIECYKDNKLIDIALNDVVISREGFSRIVSIQTSINDSIINKYRGDGIVISTATGSTGYNLSLGGPVLSPKCKNIIITPIACHSLLSRSIVLDESEEINITILHSRKTQEKEAILTVDGRKNIDLHSGDILEIKKSNKKAKLIKINTNFFDLCNTKLKENI